MRDASAIISLWPLGLGFSITELLTIILLHTGYRSGRRIGQPR
jgi:hypothetical protein